MAELSPTQKYGFTLSFKINSLNISFTEDVLSAGMALPPMSIGIAKGEQTISTPTKEIKKSGHDQFEASWSDIDLKINLKLQKKQDGMFVSKKIKFNLRVGNVTQNNKSKILAIVSFDIASLRLASQAGPVLEKKILSLKPVKTAAKVIVSAELLMDVTHEVLLVNATSPVSTPSNSTMTILSNEVSPCSSPEPSPISEAPPKPPRSWVPLDSVVKVAVEEHEPAKESLSKHRKTVSGANLLRRESPKQRKHRSHSLAELLRPTQNTAKDVVTKKLAKSGAEGISYYGSHDLLGVLRVRAKGVVLPEDVQLTLTSCSPVPDDNESDTSSASPPVTSNTGLYCVFTVNGGNTRVKSSVVKVVPNRPILYEEEEPDRLFYTNQSRQLFVLCRKVELTEGEVPVLNHNFLMENDADRSDTCIGASILPLIECPSHLDGSVKEHEVSLPLQPKGSIKLGMFFTPLMPRCRISCEGTLTIVRAQDLLVPPLKDCEISCTVKIDKDVLESTSPAPIMEYSTEGWRNEPIHFTAKKNIDFDIQLWAYSEDGTTAWCGVCILPIGYIVPLDRATSRNDVKSSHYGDKAVTVSEEYKERLLLEIEPQGQLELIVNLKPSQLKSTSGEEQSASDTPQLQHQSKDASPPVLPSPVQGSPVAPVKGNIKPSSKTKSLKRTASLRRKKNQIIQQSPLGVGLGQTSISRESTPPVTVAQNGHRPEANADVINSVSKSDLEQENEDLKREIEYLREELRRAKAELAECQFFREKAETELKNVSGNDKSKKFKFFGLKKKDKDTDKKEKKKK